MVEFKYSVGEEVNDLILGKKVTIIGIEYRYGRIGFDSTTTNDTIQYWVNDHYMNGSRLDHELSKVEPEQIEFEKYLQEYYEFLRNSQEPFDARFMQVWDENIDKLYEN